jgi:DNA helicase-2/ATP-dependent DNA helicase PcrA
MVVGDMDQSIYGWRGADPRSLARLLDDYTEASTVMLDLNYRSTVTIANAAQVGTMLTIKLQIRQQATHWR